MASNIIGYFGIESYEIILYLSRILYTLNRKVLLVDQSEIGDLTNCIPIPVGMDSADDIISYSGVDFTRKNINLDLINDYDDILISFGFNETDAAQYCNKVVYTVNQMLHNICRLSKMKDINGAEKSILIKDMVKSKIAPEYIIDYLKKDFEKEKVIVLDFDEIDMKYKILAQHDPLFRFKRITRKTKNYLIATVMELYPEVTDKDLKEAYRIAERGR